MEPKEEPVAFNFNSRTKKILSLAWNATGEYLATFSSDSTIKIWSYDDQDLFKAFDLKGHSEKVSQISWHPTNEQSLASVGYDSTLRIWDCRGSSSL